MKEEIQDHLWKQIDHLMEMWPDATEEDFVAALQEVTFQMQYRQRTGDWLDDTVLVPEEFSPEVETKIGDLACTFLLQNVGWTMEDARVAAIAKLKKEEENRSGS